MSLLNVDNITVLLQGRQVLHDVSMSVDAGEIVTIVGPNGSGKSTLIKAIVGALKPTTGKISRAPNCRLGYVPQKLHIDMNLPLSVERFLSLPRKTTAALKQAALRRVGLTGLEQRQVAKLSGGQFQRVLLARAILENPNLLILDEATQGLDQKGAADFYKLIDELRTDLGCAILMVSHELHVVMSASDRVICLNGHVCCHGTPDIVADAPEYRALFGSGTHGALALYRHDHDHNHDHSHEDSHAG